MPLVWIPSLLQPLTSGQETVAVPGETVGQVIENLDSIYPGLKARLCVGSRLRHGLAVVVDGEPGRRGLFQSVSETSEIHFVPAISGG